MIRLRRVLIRFCSPDTMSRIVDPVLADMRFESGRPAWRGYLSLARALALQAGMSIPDAARRLWADDGYAIPRAAALTARVAMATALVLVLPPLHHTARFVAFRMNGAPAYEVLGRSVLLLLPQALVVTLAPSLLFALPVAVAPRPPTARLARRTIALALACVLATATLLVWAMPRANQAFRVLMSGDEHLAPGPNEVGFAALRERITTLQLTPGGAVAARPLEFLLHVRIALTVSPLPFALLALALVRTSLARRWPRLTGLAGIGFSLFVMFPLELLGETMAASSRAPAALFAWLPIVAVLALAAVIAHATSAAASGARA